MANKRITELVQITAPELTVEDLLLLADVSAQESKKLRLDDISTFVFTTPDIKLSGSLYGTSSWAENSNFALTVPVQNTASYSLVSGLALQAVSSSYIPVQSTASYSITSSYANTASYAVTSLHITVIDVATQAYTASYLYYSPSISNGTASHAISTLNSQTSSFSHTASVLIGTASYSNTASFAIYALSVSGSGASSLYALSASYASSSRQALYATQSLTSLFLYYGGTPNGTASYALSAGSYPNFLINYGTYQAHTQSSDHSRIDRFDINSRSTSGNQSSSFQAWGTLYVASDDLTTTTGSIELVAINRQTGITSSIDSSPIDVILPASAAGAFVYPFSLAGDATLTGSYSLYVTCSGNIKPLLVGSRKVRFNISSTGEVNNIMPYESMSLQIASAGNHLNFYYTSSGNSYYGNDSKVAYSGSNVTHIDITGLNVDTVKYVWTLRGLKSFSSVFNPTLVDVGGMPKSIVTMSVYDCNLIGMESLQNTSASHLDIHNNNLFSLPALPSTMSYIDCSINNISSLPSTLPYGVRTFLANYNNFVAVSTILPSSLISMSFGDCNSLVSLTSAFPSSLAYFDCFYTQLSNLPSMSPSMKYIKMNNCFFPVTVIDYVTTQLVGYALTNGSIDVSGNVVSASGYTATTAANLGILKSRGWTVVS